VKIADPDQWKDYPKLELAAPAQGSTNYNNRKNITS